MKKTAFFIVFLAVVLFSLGILSSCSQPHTHSFSEWRVVEEANCSNTGKRVRDCSCGEIQEEIVPKNDVHDYEETIKSPATASSSGTKKLTCKRCGYTTTVSYDASKLSSEQIYAIAEKTVVEIVTYDKSGKGLSLGSGFVIEKDGQIVTNFHVIDNAYSIKVTLGKKTYNVTNVIAYNKNLDLAIIKTDGSFVDSVTLNTNLQPGGSPAYAVGSSEGYTLSFSSGTVASPDRVFSDVHYIQHSSPISHGNSGGPLFNAFGEVVGINTSYDVDGQNLNFAIQVSELDKLSKTTSMTMKQFYEKEGPYFEITIGEYNVQETESNNTYASSQKITTNGTTINGSINGSTDFDVYRIVLSPGYTLYIVMVPSYKDDNEGILLGLSDVNYETIDVAMPDEYNGTAMQSLTYTNNSSSSQTLYCVMSYMKDYIYRNAVGNYKLFFYAKK